jgi:hypothetical protein
MNSAYEIILLITLLKSMVLVRKFTLSSQNFLFIYLLVTFLVEVFSWIVLLIDIDSKWSFQYNLYCIFCILFFWSYYSRQFHKNLKKKINLLLILLIICILGFTMEENLESKLVIALPMFYILFAMLWFYQKIAFPSKDKITDDPNFWISTALLLWSCFFIFRVIPRYFFDTTDKGFLILLRELVYIINCIMYLLFFKALIKYETIAKNINK